LKEGRKSAPREGKNERGGYGQGGLLFRYKERGKRPLFSSPHRGGEKTKEIRPCPHY